MHEAIQRGLVRACHDLSEGGLAVALAEMCLAGGWGARIDQGLLDLDLEEEVRLFSESNTRFVVEVSTDKAQELAALFSEIDAFRQIGSVLEYPMLQISGEVQGYDPEAIAASIADLKEAWQKPLRW